MDALKGGLWGSVPIVVPVSSRICLQISKNFQIWSWQAYALLPVAMETWQI